jgi:hypothetical protein
MPYQSRVALSGVLFTIDQSTKDFKDFERVKKECFDETLMTPTEEMKNLAEELTGVMNLQDDQENLMRLYNYCNSESAKEDKFTLRKRLLHLVSML